MAIDPKGMAGTAAFDALTMCSYRQPSPGKGIDLLGEMIRRIEVFSEAARVDSGLARRCVQARAVTGLLWDLARGDVPRTGNFQLRWELSDGLLI